MKFTTDPGPLTQRLQFNFSLEVVFSAANFPPFTNVVREAGIGWNSFSKLFRPAISFDLVADIGAGAGFEPFFYSHCWDSRHNRFTITVHSKHTPI